MTFALTTGRIDRVRLGLLADGLAVAVAVALPWSTSATAISIVVWLLVLLATMDVAMLRRELETAAGGLPVLLWTLAAVGMLWAVEATWAERIDGFGGFHRLLVIPFLLAQFRRSEHGHWVLYGFLASAAGVLIVSWWLILAPGLTWRGRMLGVPVHDYMLQGNMFVICAFALLGGAGQALRARSWQRAAGLAVLAMLFLVNIAFIQVSRTVIVVATVLLLLFGWRQFGWRGALAACLVGVALGGVLWVSSATLRERVAHTLLEAREYETSDAATSVGMRLEFWKKSLGFINEAPVIGNGTGSMRALFRRAAVGEGGASAVASVNPHNQIFNVAIQLGLVGVAMLLAMWAAHLALFRGGGLTAWIGLVVVVQNVVSSLANSHLFDFSHGWLYVFGVGVVGGMTLRERAAAEARP